MTFLDDDSDDDDLSTVSLDSVEIRRGLTGFSMDVGPSTPTTRRTLSRLLAKCQRDGYTPEKLTYDTDIISGILLDKTSNQPKVSKSSKNPSTDGVLGTSFNYLLLDSSLTQVLTQISFQ